MIVYANIKGFVHRLHGFIYVEGDKDHHHEETTLNFRWVTDTKKKLVYYIRLVKHIDFLDVSPMLILMS